MNTGQDQVPYEFSTSAPTPVFATDFSDRRDPHKQRQSNGLERRQFTDSRDHYSDDAAELGKAIDQYKLMHRRRFINYEELLAIVKSVGYEKKAQ